jgi:ribosomal protein S24E
LQLKQNNFQMEFKIISEIKNPLFDRKEIEGEIRTNITPSRTDVAKLLSEKFSVPVENIKIRTILGKFGSKIFIINANIYSSKEDKDKIEIKKKKDIEAEKKLEEAIQIPKEIVQEEKPAENEKKEDLSQ